MSRKIVSRFGWALFSLMTAVPLQAQEVATLALRNGERPSGELIDMNGSSFFLRVNGQDRQFSIGDVSAVEFVVGAPPADAQNRINAGQPVVVMRSGQVIEGRLSDIGGTRPLRLTIDTPSGERQFTSSDVAQIYVNPIARSAAAQAPAGVGTSGGPGAITIPANQAWVDTGITVVRGQPVQFAASGDIMISGNASSGIGGSPAATVQGIRYPVADAPVGALIGRIGNNGRPFLIGANSGPIPMPATGRIMLGVNDDHVGDNTGNFTVTVTRLGR